MARLLLSLLLAAGLGGCYKIDIQQGNVLDQTLLERVSEGMSKRQVTALLGTPVIADPFNANRWDYVYDFFPNANEDHAERRRVTLFFNGEVLSSIQGAAAPLEPLAQQQASGPDL